LKSPALLRKNAETDSFVMWSCSLPAYVLHFTDYSPTRKEPLKKSVSVAPDQTGLDALFDAELEDNIKKGWEKV